MNVRPISSEDVILWPDGTWCYRHDLEDYSHMSDDYEVVPYGTVSWFGVTETEST